MKIWIDAIKELPPLNEKVKVTFSDNVIYRYAEKYRSTSVFAESDVAILRRKSDFMGQYSYLAWDDEFVWVVEASEEQKNNSRLGNNEGFWLMRKFQVCQWEKEVNVVHILDNSNRWENIDI